MLLVYSEIAELVDDGLVLDMIMLDFAKVFDVISHMLLLDKSRDIGVNGT